MNKLDINATVKNKKLPANWRVFFLFSFLKVGMGNMHCFNVLVKDIGD